MSQLKQIALWEFEISYKVSVTKSAMLSEICAGEQNKISLIFD